MNNALICLAVVSLVGLCVSTRSHALTIEGFTPDATVVYKTIGKVELKLHIFNPENHKKTDKRPAIVFFFGGGWSGGSPSQFYPHCEYLASRGMVAMSAEYRVAKTHKTTPQACVKDGKSAVRWIRRNAKDLGIDPERLLAGGGSAGGHVAATTGTTAAFNEEGEDTSVSCIPAALVLFNPVFDNGPTGYGHSRVKDYWKDFSPMHNINKQTPPTVVFLGDKDNLIPVATAEAYKKKMEDLGLRCDVHIYKGQGHGFFNASRGGGKMFKATMTDADKFLTSLGYLKGEPTL